jgi:hypothetical protein
VKVEGEERRRQPSAICRPRSPRRYKVTFTAQCPPSHLRVDACNFAAWVGLHQMSVSLYSLDDLCVKIQILWVPSRLVTGREICEGWTGRLKFYLFFN